jgi:asparagine synthase (glutamine-hydrolysing)
VERRVLPGETAAIKLSGGLDSSVVAALAARAAERTGSPPAAYSATFPSHPSVDESALIEGVTRELGLPWVQIRVLDGSVLAGALEYIHAWQAPPVSPNGFFWGPLLSRAADDGVDVLLDGEGGDEVFGLSPYLMADRIRRGRLIAAARLARRVPGFPGAERPPWGPALRLVREYGARGGPPYALHRALRSRRDPARYAPEWFTAESARLLFEGYDQWSWKRARGPRWQASLVGWVVTNPAPAMTHDHVRRRSALAGLEARHPLVDVDVVNLMLRIPPELAFDPRYSRPLLREAMHGLVPDEVRLRHAKSNFDAVFHERMAGGDLDPVRELLCSRDAEIGAYVKPDVVRELVERPPLDDRGALGGWALEVWRLVTAECWLRSQADRSFAADLLSSGRLAEPRFEFVAAGSLA